MKKIFKLIPAALAVVALASCSNDELFGEKAEVVQKVKDGLTVQVEDLNGASTRQANATYNKHSVVWEEGDQINVYDNKLTLYDEYKFVENEKKFKGDNEEGATRISSTQYALFPADRVDYAGWSSEGTKTVMRIPEIIFYDEESEFGSGTNYAYVSNLPMWGTATGTYPEAEVSLHYLTGVLRLNIQNAFAQEANFVKIESQDDQPISGAFQAILSEGTTVKTEAQLEQGSAALQTDNAIYIDLRNAPSYITNLYIPIIARYYDYLKVGITNIELDATALPENSEQIIEALDALEWNEDKTTGWETIRNWDAGITFNRGKMKSLYEETQFDLSGVTTCEMLSETFAQYENYEIGSNTPADILELTIGGENGLFVTRTNENYKDDYTVYVPNMKPTKIIVNIPAGINAGDPDPDLMFVDKNIKDPFQGELVINVMDAGIATGKLNSITVNLPKADFRLAGQIAEGGIADFTPDDNNPLTGRGGIQIKNVDDLFFGDGETETDITATVKVNTAKTVNITDKAKLTSDLDLVNTKNIEQVNINAGGELVSVEDGLEVLNATVNCDGTQGDDAFVYGSKGTVNIGGEAGTMKNLYTIGDVNIANTKENVAITGILSLLGNNTVTLKQGYIKEIVYNQEAGAFSDETGTGKYGKNPNNYGRYYVKPLEALTTSDCRSKLVTIKLDEIIGDGLTAIGSVQEEMLTFDAAQAQAASGAHIWNFIKFTDSKWGGKVPGENFQGYALGKRDGHIYTATELAAIEGCAVEDGIVLYNNFDLNNEPWTNPDLTVNFDGEDPRWATAEAHLDRIEDVCAIDLLKEDKVHTISNLYLKDETDNTATGDYDEDEQFGLLGLFEGEVCKNFIINKVKTKTLDGTIQIGAVAGVADGAKSFTNIQVANAKLGGTTYFQETPIYKGVRYVGGLIGKAKVTAELSIYLNKISKTTISGQGYMGGLIGAAVDDNTVKIDRNNVSISGFVVGPQPENYDMVNKNYGTVGMAIGQVDATDINIDETRAYDAGGGDGTKVELGLVKENKFNDAITGNRKALGFLYNFLVGKYTDSAMEYVAGNQLKYGFYGGDVLFGYSPNSKTNIKAKDALSPLSSVEDWTHDATIWVAKDKDTFVDDTEVDPKYRLNGYLQFTPYLDADPAY